MPYEAFHCRFPDIAEAETRRIKVLESSTVNGLPLGEYEFVEMFCNERGCDCRRAFFSVFSSTTNDIEAVIAYGWETKDFYRKWNKYGTDEDIRILQGPDLNFGSPQGAHAEDLLELFKNLLLKDKPYIERVKRHYKLFRSKVDMPKNPLFRRRRTGG